MRNQIVYVRKSLYLNKSMKHLIYSLILVVIGALVGIYLPWYAMGVAFGLLAFVLNMPLKSSFLTGFIAGFVLWVVAALWLDLQHPSTLPSRMAQVFPLKGNVFALFVLTGVLGGLFSGIWTWVGARLRQK
jgi:ABC-type multidrug transport system fused ATPase/permease subunit